MAGETGPTNGVHGWVFLDCNGVPCRPTTEAEAEAEAQAEAGGQPVVQLVFVDGLCAAGYLPETLLPNYQVRLCVCVCVSTMFCVCVFSLSLCLSLALTLILTLTPSPTTT